MNKYQFLYKDYQELKRRTVGTLDEAGGESFKKYYNASLYRIWAVNRGLYSRDYRTALEILHAPEKYSDSRIRSAMSEVSGEGIAVKIPDFFKVMVERDLKDGAGRAAAFVTGWNSLLAAGACINGDFTVEEAREVSAQVGRLVSYAKGQGLALQAVPDHSSRITEPVYDSYVNGGKYKAKEESPYEKMSKDELNQSLDDILKDFYGKKAPVPEAIRPEAPAAEPRKQQEAADAEPAAEPEPQPEPQRTQEELLAELDGLVGLTTVKEDVHSLINFIKVAKLREERGMKVPTLTCHLVFTGNPGTGKTTVARLIGELYRAIGILPKGQLVEVDRSTLVGGYLGQTAIKTKEAIDRAMGGVLFVDEAYSLANDDRDAYGKEAIETILKAMEDHRDELVVIVAGYDDLMHQFINSNPGLQSRFSKYFHFPDYTGEEMMQIFLRFCSSNGYTAEEAAAQELQAQFNRMYDRRDEHFGNARTVRNLFEKTVNCQANRLAALETVTDEELQALTLTDVQEAVRRSDNYEEMMNQLNED